MRIGVLVSGLMGSKLGTLFARARHEVIFRFAPLSPAVLICESALNLAHVPGFDAFAESHKTAGFTRSG
jgi:hypothetical protein